MSLQKTEQNRPLAALGEQQGKLSSEIENLVDRIFDQLLASCPSIQYWSEKQVATAKQQWILGFAENHIRTIDQVRQGMKALRAKEDDFVPSVGKFIGWCKRIDFEELGLPIVEQLLKRLNYFSAFGFSEIHEFKFRSDAEYWLLTDLYERNCQHSWKDETLRNQAEKALIAMAKRIQSGETIPAPAITLPKKSECYVPPEDVISNRFAELKAKMGIKQ